MISNSRKPKETQITVNHVCFSFWALISNLKTEKVKAGTKLKLAFKTMKGRLLWLITQSCISDLSV